MTDWVCNHDLLFGYNPPHTRCSICLRDEYDVEADAVVQCDSCGVAVHEACYGVLGKELEELHTNNMNEDAVSSTDTMP
ncbi:hypothetical protein BV898_17356 [Hypsibius exemplaris]|uniref:PHD-type domain-containing protein n=1 Tax=Hypsibius exemplaris TaxID=2072580 RepID=A0A9X6NNH3_HYPEX|nr:hypothetical protein BV898_17356 [Hypsibius exemplaris]